ncbi:MAG: penicillin-binding protein 2 [Patescibacteria group bacterium]|nr:penicillin-binding protein 2 [Patescibacteria group bacterium]
MEKKNNKISNGVKLGGKKENKDDPFVIRSGRFGQVRGFSYRLGWTEDSFTPGGEEREAVGRTFNFSKLRPRSIFIILALAILLGRSAWLQIVKGNYYYSLAEGNRIRIERLEPKRGIIYDKDLNPLVRNVANSLLYLIPIDLPRDEEARNEIIGEMSGILSDLPAEEIKNKLAKIKIGTLDSYQPLFIADNIPYEKAMLLYLKSANMPGVFLANKTRREYGLSAPSLAHVLGYTGKINEKELEKSGDEYLPIDYIGKTGIEYFWENELKGESGKKYIEVDALGKEKKIISQTKTNDGHNLVLSLDSDLQKKLEEVVAAYLKKLNLNKAAAVIMDPNNGEILAMSSFPAYDSNKFAKGISPDEYAALLNSSDNPLFNRVISGEYPSGSTIKPVIAAAALEEKIISEYTSFLSVGGISIGQWFFPDWKAGGHGLTDVRKALAQSVNTFFYYIGGGFEDFIGLGVERIVNYAKLFGLGAQTGVDLAGEAAGFLPTEEWKEKTKGEQWYIGDTYHLAIGQGDLLVTPLQVANYTSVFANGGRLYRPHLVKEILTSDDKLVREVENAPVRSNFIDPYNIEVVRQGMRQTVTSGSAASLGSLPVAVAGKTGSAQWSSKEKTHAWFTGFAPYDKPEIVITILVEQGGEGSDVAVKIAREVMQWYFSR